MKKFEDICMMSQREVKLYMHGYLANKKYEVVNRDGFLYAKGDIPVLLVAHMDTVHDKQCVSIINHDGKLSSLEGIGGDDRCGIFIIMNIIKTMKCSVLLCEDEEIGGIGAGKFTRSEYAKDVDVNYIIEFDRKGSADAVFYSCANKEFEEFVCDNTGFKKAYGTFSDISILAPALKIAAVNLSCGYYNAHTTKEYVMYDEMMDIVDTARMLISIESKPFEYVAASHKWNYYDKYDLSLDSFKQYDMFEEDKLRRTVMNDLEIELEAIWLNYDNKEEVGWGKGNTKAEAWVDFFTSYPDISFGMIIDYNFN